MPAAPTGPLILLVDDLVDFRASLRMLLEAENFRVLEAGDAATALAWLHSTRVDLLLVDVFLPGQMGGLDLIHQVSQMTMPRPAVIAISGHTFGKSGLEAALAAGANATLAKPFGRDELVRLILSVLRPNSPSLGPLIRRPENPIQGG